MFDQPSTSEWPERLYRLLLLAYPTKFRQEFGEEMMFLFQESYRDAHERRSLLSTLDFTACTLADWLRSSVREHWEGELSTMLYQNFKNSELGSLLIALAACVVALSTFFVEDAALTIVLLQFVAVAAFWNFGLKWFLTTGRMQLGLLTNGEDFYASNVLYRLLKTSPRLFAVH